MTTKLTDKIVSSEGVTAQWVKLNAELCKKLLDKVPEYQRVTRKSNSLRLQSALRNGEFCQNGEPVIISDKGELIDGQHRVEAFLATSTFPEVLMVSGVKGLESYITIDQGASRALHDVFRAAEVKGSIKKSTISRILIELENQRLKSGGFHSQKILDYYWLNAGTISYWYAKNLQLDTILPSSVRAAICCYIEIYHSRSHAEEFADTLITGVGPKTYQTLRTTLVRNANKARGKLSQSELLFICCKAAKAHIEKGITIKQIKLDGAFPYFKSNN